MENHNDEHEQQSLPTKRDFVTSADDLDGQHAWRCFGGLTLEEANHRLSGRNQTDGKTYRSSMILCDQSIVGHISHIHYRWNDTPLCYCGWDLDPQFWGQGIMRAALAQLFDELFLAQETQHAFAECFRHNQRCLRLVNKLKFFPVPILLPHRILNAWRTRCLRWILRFQLDRAAWLNLDSAQPAADPGVTWL